MRVKSIFLAIIAVVLVASSVFAASSKKLPAKTQKKNTAKITEAEKITKEAASIVAAKDNDVTYLELKERIDSLKRENNDAKLSGEIRFAWTKNVENAVVKNNFDITRAYITVKKKLDRGASARVTLDVSRLSPSTTTPQSLFDYLKYAYVELPVNTAVPFTAKLGLQQTVWIDWADKIWGNSYVMKQFDDNESIMSSADFGLGATGKITLSNLPEVEYHATVLNGGGYKVAEADSAKDIAIRLNSDVYSDENAGKVVVGGYINSKAGILNSGTANSKQVALLVGLINRTYGNVYAEYMNGTNVNGYSVGGFVYPAPQTIPGVGVLARIDNYDPDTTIDNNDNKRSLMGTFYDWGKDVRIALDYQTYQQGSNAVQKTTYLHTVIYY